MQESINSNVSEPQKTNAIVKKAETFKSRPSRITNAGAISYQF